jgi:hypothetical protein
MEKKIIKIQAQARKRAAQQRVAKLKAERVAAQAGAGNSQTGSDAAVQQDAAIAEAEAEVVEAEAAEAAAAAAEKEAAAAEAAQAAGVVLPQSASAGASKLASIPKIEGPVTQIDGVPVDAAMEAKVRWCHALMVQPCTSSMLYVKVLLQHVRGAWGLAWQPGESPFFCTTITSWAEASL